MGKRLFYHLLLAGACVIGSLLPGTGTWAAPALSAMQGESPAASRGRGILVIEFGAASPAGSKLGDAIVQASREFSPFEAVAAADGRAVEHLLEGRSDIGLVVLVHPQDHEMLARLPGLYPDLVFTAIDAREASYASNVQNVQFREEEGVFLLGAIAAIRSSEPIAVMAMQDDDHSRRMEQSFRAGVLHIRPDASVSSLMDIKPTASQRTRIASTVASAFQSGVSVLFSMDDDIVEQALRAAKPERKLVISGNPPGANADTTRLMTSLVKRYDLALLDVLRIYTHRQWHAGTIELGVTGGYVDYSLNAENVDIFPKEAIDRIEAIKDYIGQGIYLKKE